jgi:hypothetical protein
MLKIAASVKICSTATKISGLVTSRPRPEESANPSVSSGVPANK